MLHAVACFALGFTAGNAVLPSSVRAPAPSMIASLETPFVYTPASGPLGANFAANMGDCAQIEVSKGYKRRIVPATPTGYRSDFLASRDCLGEALGKHFTLSEFPGEYSAATSGMVMPTAEPKAAAEEVVAEEAVSA